MGPTWGLPAPDGPHVGPMNLVTWADMLVTIVAADAHQHPQYWSMAFFVGQFH